MLILNRILPKGVITVILAVRSTRQQAKESDDLGIVAIVAAGVMALWTYRKEKSKRQREESESRVSLKEILGG